MLDPLLYPTVLSIMIQGVIGIISQIQHSRCSEIRGCCIECKREVPKEEVSKTIQLEEIQSREV
tara:strand:+ start:43 stop:234 length:192 start_codon:yes stop_codon:yes gene_type:complete